MTSASTTKASAIIVQAEQALRKLLCDTEKEIQLASTEFQELNTATETILNLTAGVVGCTEDESLSTILPKVQQLGSEARRFMLEQFMTGSGILETVQSEVILLERLSDLTSKQRSIARETQMLSLLTNIEVARMGETGAGFEYLARQLGEFAGAIAAGTQYLATHTDERKIEIQATRRKLAVELPRIKQLFAEIDSDLEVALIAADSGLKELAQAPANFRVCVEEITGQIRGVVSAIQSHDITRQQIEHVQTALGQIARMQLTNDQEVQLNPSSCAVAAENVPRVSAGLIIQVYQLRNIERTVQAWVTQIQECVQGILRISTSDVVKISPLVLAQERELTLQVEKIAELEHTSEGDSKGIEETISGLTNLMQLVGEHEVRSKTLRDQLQLLSFNSIIEARRLGSKASAILEISQSIKEISIAWSAITERSVATKEEILALVEQSHAAMGFVSEDGNCAFRDAHTETSAGLEKLRQSASFADRQSLAIDAAIEQLKQRIASAKATSDRLHACFAQLGAIITQLEFVRESFLEEYPNLSQNIDFAEMERVFAGSYSTQVERDVLWAALRCESLPASEQSLEGNNVELF